MATPPQVLNLQDTIASLTAANQPLLANLDTQDQNVVASGQAQTQGIEAAKGNAFNQITNNAATRGALFSGFSPDAQATYTGSTYLPALAKLQQAITDSRTAIQGQRAGIQSNIATTANQQVQQSQTALEKWQADQEDLAAQQAEAQRQREFQAQQAGLDRGLKASEGAKDRSLEAAKISSSSAKNSTESIAKIQQSLAGDIVSGINNIVSGKAGGAGATEQLLKQLVYLYPEVNPKTISSQIYKYRKPLESSYKF